ncbi:MAG: hypothetical protein C3F11_03750 [Methylocystaceae bacterium]|nr:MAG: hypothetical protein C3F11_03750 [Methylocystaceae bacterium]
MLLFLRPVRVRAPRAASGGALRQGRKTARQKLARLGEQPARRSAQGNSFTSEEGPIRLRSKSGPSSRSP